MDQADNGSGGGRLRRWRWPIMLAGPVVIAAIVAYLFVMNGRVQTTENAYVQIAKTAVAPSISGRVVEILVHENQKVRRGQILFRLDPRDLEAAAAAAEAELAAAQFDLEQKRELYRRDAANLAAAKETLTFNTREAERLRRMAASGVASQKEADQAAHEARQAREQVAAAEAQAAQSLAALGGDAGGGARAPAVLRAEAQLKRARLNLSYVAVVAPADGIVARVDQLPVGAYLNASQTAFWLLSGRPWVEANFKEDQVARMRVGQAAEVRVDAYPGKALKGRVASFAPGTGLAFSALPAQNATGNWVKVTQRLPVRIEFDKPPPDMAARAGLSAKVTVDIRNTGRDG